MPDLGILSLREKFAIVRDICYIIFKPLRGVMTLDFCFSAQVIVFIFVHSYVTSLQGGTVFPWSAGMVLATWKEGTRWC